MAASTKKKREKRVKSGIGEVIDFNSVGRWKKVDVDPNVFVDENFAGFSGIEELESCNLKNLHGLATGCSKKLNTINKEPAPKKRKKRKQVDKPKPATKKKRQSGGEICREIKKRRRERKAELENEIDMSAWSDLPLPDSILMALKEVGFNKPTPIQAQCLRPAIEDKIDIVGAAETGSGKTLAFGIPILDMILKCKLNKNGSQVMDKPIETNVRSKIKEVDDVPSISTNAYKGRGDLLALILTPTRELAVQIKNHIVIAAKFTDIKIAVVVGGMSQEKQMRILKQKPEIVVGTPGRIWELYQQGEPHLLTLPHVRCLVIDEADRMVERSHFAELTDILDVLNSSPFKSERQTLIFSATLSLVHSGPVRKLLNWKQRTQQDTLGSLMDKVGLKTDAKIVDLTPKGGTVSTLLESKIVCTIDQKDIYLLYFLLQYPGRTLVFCNSIDCIRRLVSILTILQCSPYPLHSSMHQRQRLKNLERFTENQKGLLLATDVASRGLDIPNVEHVIHYQVPRTAEIYIHRSGRTARQAKQGLSIMLLSSKEISYYRTVCKTLDKEEIVNFPVDHSYLREVTSRVQIAREIDVLTHQYEKKIHKNEWFEQAAKEMDIILDEELILEDLGTSHDQKTRRHKLSSLEAEIRFLLKKKIFPSGYSQLFITSSGSLVSPLLAANQKEGKNAITKLASDKHFSKDKEKRGKREKWKQRKLEEAQDTTKQKRNRNKYSHFDKKSDKTRNNAQKAENVLK